MVVLFFMFYSSCNGNVRVKTLSIFCRKAVFNLYQNLQGALFTAPVVCRIIAL